MNYKAHYARLIERAKGRVLPGYYERHHVIPRCMGGNNDPENIVSLTPEEHYVAHQLLVKANPRNGRLVHAAVLMSGRCSGNKAYGWLRRRHIAQLTENMQGNSHTLGKKLPPFTIERSARASAKMLGNRYAVGNKNALGQTLSPETRAKMSAVRRGVSKSAETRARMSAALVGNKYCLGRKHTEEARAKMSAAWYPRSVKAA